MITVNSVVIEYFSHSKPVIDVVSRGAADFYKTLRWPVGKPLNAGTIKTQVAKEWKVTPDQVVILENVEIPKL